MTAGGIRTKILALWSAPRCRSTAFFRMMCERGDFRVLHEPFSYLAEFGEVTVAGAVVRQQRELLKRLRELGGRAPLFVKDTTDERYQDVLDDHRFLAYDAVHTFIIRNPTETIASYYAVNPEVKCHQIGFEAQYELFQAVWESTEKPPLVVEAADLVANPAGVIEAYCAAVSIPYIADALTWRPEARAEWRPSERWHADVSASTGFHARRRSQDVDVAAHSVLGGYLEHHRPFYEKLRAHRLAPATR